MTTFRPNPAYLNSAAAQPYRYKIPIYKARFCQKEMNNSTHPINYELCIEEDTIVFVFLKGFYKKRVVSMQLKSRLVVFLMVTVVAWSVLAQSWEYVTA
jgi:hypothetical protein